MIQNEIFKGKWSLPGQTESHSGTLTFNPIDGAQLEIYGNFRTSHALSRIDIVHGHTLDGWVTLLNVRHGTSTGSNITGANVTKYIAIYIFVGHRFESVEELRFRYVKFSLFNLLDWLNPTVIREQSNQEHYHLEYDTPAPISFNCYDGCAGKIECFLNRQSTFGFFDVDIKQGASIKLIYDHSKSYKEVIEDTLTFQRFLTLSTYEQSYPIEIDLQDDLLQESIKHGREKRNIPKTIKLIYRSPFYSPVYKSRRFYQHLIKYDSIAHKFESIISEWFKQSKEFEQPLELLLRSFTNKYDFSIEKFMDIVKATELFHRLRFSNSVLTEDEFEARKAKFFLPELTSKEREWIEGRMKHGNEPSLFKRLKALVKAYRFSYFDERVKDRDKFCIQASDNRNYYTHFDPSMKQKSSNGKELFGIMENLKLILLAGILNNVGITSDVFEQSIRGLIY